jgi:murein DD-endopeptidase MepM/ murein hydrolase activator NlpD
MKPGTSGARTRVGLACVALVSALAAGGASAGADEGGISTSDGGSGATAGHVFPVKGPHRYGDGLGAGRNHMGQDLLADCGQRVRAARGGRVTVRDYQARGAGYHVVINGRGTDRDYVYMHMKRRIAVRKGERVETGETIGRVGSTGRSTACHLHFELWSAPGWYRGGRVLDPTPPLRRWDRYS